MALKDNDFEDQEKKTIIKIATRLGLNISDIESAFSQPSLRLEVPLSLSERIQHLHDLVLIMLADGVLHEEEIKYISLLTKAYGLDDNFDGNPIVIDLQGMKNQLSFQRFIEDYRKITADVLSSIVIDDNFNIRFPLYKTELSNLGPLPRTLYIFFLLQKDPINIADLSHEKNKMILSRIYSLMPSSDFNVQEKIANLTNPDGLSFNSNRSIVKKSIINALPKDNPDLINNYLIGGSRNQRKSVPLNKDLINFPATLVAARSI